MIEIAYDGVDARERERWRVALSMRPAIARPARGLDLGIAVFVGLAWAAAYLATLEVLVLPFGPTQIGALVLRGVAAVGLVAIVRSALRERDAKRAPWRSGRFLFTWGFADVDEGVLRVVPVGSLELVVRGRVLGLGPRRLELHDHDGWSTTLLVRDDELAAVAAMLEPAAVGALDAAATSYRDAPSALVGAAARRYVPATTRDAAALAAGAVIGTFAPLLLLLPLGGRSAAERWLTMPGPAAGAATAATAATLASSAPQAPFAIDVASCTPAPLVVGTVASYLALGLESPGLGPARPFVLPTLTLPEVRDGVWARCTWRVDAETGLMREVDAHWGIEAGGRRRRERRATIRSADVLAVVDRCGALDRRLDVSPEGLARASLALALATIGRDVREVADHSISLGDAWMFACARDAAAVPATDVVIR